MDWFRHDVNAHDDTKIRKLVYKHGVSAYGAYWIIIELLYKNEGKASDQEVEDEFELMAVEGLKEAFEKSGLFDISEDGTWTSNRVTEEICFQNEARLKRANAGRLGGLAKASNAKAMLSDAKAEPSECLAKSSTLPNLTLPTKKDTSPSKDGSVSKESKAFHKPTFDEVKAYCEERKNGVDPQRFMDYYETRNWIPSGSRTQMKDWKAAVRTWESGNGRASVTSQKTNKHKDYSDVKPEDFDMKNFNWGV